MDYQFCTLCPRCCGANRARGTLGYCKMPAELRAAKAMLHFGEEPVISGTSGTGAIFFSGCTLRCVFCQNEEISTGGLGQALSSQQLRELMEQLIEKGAQSIDLVTPTHFLPTILPALTPKLPVPVVYNCGGYERVETLQALEGLVDVYLPDFKYADHALAAKLSAAPDYFEVATKALREMYRQTGPAVVENEQLKRGMLVRHLVLPGYLENTLRVLDWLADAFPVQNILVSLMSQYVPMGSAAKFPPLNRRITGEEYDGAVSWMELCGFTRGYCQDFSSATTEYLPDFQTFLEF